MSAMSVLLHNYGAGILLNSFSLSLIKMGNGFSPLSFIRESCGYNDTYTDNISSWRVIITGTRFV